MTASTSRRCAAVVAIFGLQAVLAACFDGEIATDGGASSEGSPGPSGEADVGVGHDAGTPGTLDGGVEHDATLQDASTETRDGAADAIDDSPVTADVTADADADAGSDASVDMDAAFDATVAVDAGFDATVDIDAGLDATVSTDAGFDAALYPEAGPDAGLWPILRPRMASTQRTQPDLYLIKGGKLHLWGGSEWAPLGYSFETISGQLDHVCAVTPAGDAYCWGWDLNGAVGGHDDACPDVSGIPCQLNPLKVALPEPVELVRAGGASCALATSGNVYCWGGIVARPADGGGTDYSPMLIPGGPYRQVVVGAGHACVLRPTGQAMCFGQGYGPASAPVPALSGYVLHALTAGYNFTCGIATTGSVVCAGIAPPWPGDAAAPLSNGYLGVCAPNAAGQVMCTAASSGSPLPAGTPTLVPPPDELVTTWPNGVCSRSGDEVYCWGEVKYHGLSYTQQPTPVHLAPPDAGHDAGSVDASDSGLSDASAFDAGPPCDPSAFLLTEPRQFTIWHEYDHLLKSDPSGSVSIQPCGPGPSLFHGNSGIVTATLTPGWYVQTISYGQPVPPDYWTTYYNPAIISEPVPPVPPSGCTPLSSGTAVTGRFVHAASRCYEITLTTTGNISATYVMNEPMKGGATLTVSSATAQSPSCYKDGNPQGGRGPCPVWATDVPAGTHRIDVNAELGTSYSLTATY